MPAANPSFSTLRHLERLSSKRNVLPTLSSSTIARTHFSLRPDLSLRNTIHTDPRQGHGTFKRSIVEEISDTASLAERLDAQRQRVEALTRKLQTLQKSPKRDNVLQSTKGIGQPPRTGPHLEVPQENVGETRNLTLPFAKSDNVRGSHDQVTASPHPSSTTGVNGSVETLTVPHPPSTKSTHTREQPAEADEHNDAEKHAAVPRNPSSKPTKRRDRYRKLGKSDDGVEYLLQKIVSTKAIDAEERNLDERSDEVKEPVPLLRPSSKSTPHGRQRPRLNTSYDDSYYLLQNLVSTDSKEIEDRYEQTHEYHEESISTMSMRLSPRPTNAEEHHGRPDAASGNQEPRIMSKSLQNTIQPRTPWIHLSAKQLEEKLHDVALHLPGINSVYPYLETLIKKWHVKPRASHYEALILANCQGEFGALQTVQHVLEEMERENIEIGASVYAVTFQVLATHPDYLFRSSILHKVRQDWTKPGPSDLQFITAGLIRDGQLELALENIEAMHEEKITVAKWLYSLMIYTLCDVEDFDAVLRLIYYMEDQREDLPPYTWHHILDRASQGLHLEMTVLVWRMMVEPSYMNPSTGLCYNVLLTAARAGDTRLADSVCKLLSHRQSRPSDVEYELMIETATKAGNEDGVERIKRHRKGFFDTQDVFGSPIRMVATDMTLREETALGRREAQRIGTGRREAESSA